MDDDLLDSVLSLEEVSYQTGFEEGRKDGSEVGFAEGITFGMEQGFQKAREMARIHGRALVLSACLSDSPLTSKSYEEGEAIHHPPVGQKSTSDKQKESKSPISVPINLTPIPRNARLRKHIDTLLKLTDTRTLSLRNSDDAVGDFDDRMQKAIAKAKIIDKLVDDRYKFNLSARTSKDPVQHAPNLGNIEELNSLSARR